MKPKVLIVDDEPEALELLEFNLRNAGFNVATAEDGAAALRKAKSQHPDLIILDLMLPEIDGLEVCKFLRRDPDTASTPIIMLTARAAEIDRVLGFELGADDYVTKPFSPRELVLRVKSMLRRGAAPPAKDIIHIGRLHIDIPAHRVQVLGQSVQLTAIEFKLLTLLAQRCGRVQTREQLLRDVWDYDATIDTRTVDTHVGRLRAKLGPCGQQLETLRGVGYRLVETDEL